MSYARHSRLGWDEKRGAEPARIHKTLRVTPAMEAGIVKHVWSLEEIVELVH